ncbi:energy-coupling factor transporter transmembrane protein EcfT [Rhizobiales bacterium RZME27]|uniref:Energy-coupling factor transporter transmembrane protein EcfT n=1 Tax=Endobacterium cereale TaxID=2663029 RepID=A0A6A8A8K5_9HYPH|nr:CbiQ family ECF transporter T component [Endobacterium cereale]MEB2846987.1 CbiQ family ECF transporter T component [Endobacterium cereale]MQY47595.1 energy-coupling factor transporter transmembrane protein EcfT [Endobacterium cereale]
MNTLYLDGQSLLHRLPTKAKLGGLTAFSLLLFMANNPVVLGVAAFVAALAYASTGIGWSTGLVRLRPAFITIAAVTLFALLFQPPVEALVILFRLTALMLAAAAITATTTIGAFIDTITWAAMPFERIGLVRAADIGLSVGLVIRFVPEVALRYRSIRDAHRARGLKVRPVTLIVPLMIHTLKNADEIAAAIDARGIR